MSETGDNLNGRRIVVGVTGGIAAFKTAGLVSTLVQQCAEVRVVMTESATRFVTPLTFQTLSSNAVHTSMWQSAADFSSAHINLADWAEACIVAPATANVIGKLRAGLADDLLSTTLLALECPVLLAPAMNSRMWGKPQVQENIKILSQWGYHFVGPEEGWLACRTRGAGRMSSVEAIIEALQRLLPARSKAAQGESEG